MHKLLLFWMPLALLAGQSEAPVAGIVEGVVTNGVTGAPIAGARVSLEATEAEPLFARTDADGRFQFANVSPGAYGVGAEKPGLQCDYASRCSMSVTLNADRPGATVAISLKPYAVLSGRVTDFNGLPIARSSITLVKVLGLPDNTFYAHVQVLPDGRKVAQAGGSRTNDRGEFRIPRIPPGTYYLVAEKSSESAWEDSANHTTYYPSAPDLASAKPVEIAAGQQVRADIRVIRQEGVRVTGRFLNLAAPAAAAGNYTYTDVTLVPQGNVLTNPGGPFSRSRSEQFELQGVRPGKYTLLAVTREPRGDASGGDQAPKLAASMAIDVPDRGLDGVQVELQPLRDVRGVVSFLDGCSPVPVRVRARCRNQIGPCGAEAVSESGGSFLLEGSGPGRLAINARGEATTDRRLTLVSAKLGDQDVMDNGFDYPFAGDAVLRVVMGCPANGSWK